MSHGGSRWTPEQRAKFETTMSAKRAAGWTNLTAGNRRQNTRRIDELERRVDELVDRISVLEELVSNGHGRVVLFKPDHKRIVDGGTHVKGQLRKAKSRISA